MYWSYSGMLTSTMTVTIKEPPFRATVEVLDMPDFDLYLPSSAESSEFVKSVGPQNGERARAKIEPFIFEYAAYESKLKEIFYETGSNKRGLINDAKYFLTKFHQYNLDFCKFDTHLEFGIPKVPGGYMYPFDSMLQPLFDRYMMTLNERGQIDEIFKKYMPKVPNCELNSNFQPVNFGFVQILFIFVCIGIFSGSVLLLFEILQDKKDRSRVREVIPIYGPKGDLKMVVKRKNFKYKVPSQNST